MRRQRVGVVLGLSAVLGLTGCTGGGGSSAAGRSSSPQATSCDNSLLAHHLGLAGGAVHELIWKPYSAGSFEKSASGRDAALGTAARAGALTWQQLGKAADLVRRCPASSGLEEQLRSTAARAAATGQQLAAGEVDVTALTDITTTLTAIETRSASLGIDVIERTPTPSELNAVAAALHT